MIAFAWGAVCGVLGLLWFMVESMSGRLQGGSSAETQVLWLVLAPICVIGSMVQHRKHVVPYPYTKAMMTGIVTSVWCAAWLTLVWVLMTLILMPEYSSYVEAGIAARSVQSGENIQQLAQRVKMARMVLSPPMLYVTSFILPIVVGSVASVIAAFGLRATTAQPHTTR